MTNHSCVPASHRENFIQPFPRFSGDKGDEESNLEARWRRSLDNYRPYSVNRAAFEAIRLRLIRESEEGWRHSLDDYLVYSFSDFSYIISKLRYKGKKLLEKAEADRQKRIAREAEELAARRACIVKTIDLSKRRRAPRAPKPTGAKFPTSFEWTSSVWVERSRTPRTTETSWRLALARIAEPTTSYRHRAARSPYSREQRRAIRKARKAERSRTQHLRQLTAERRHRLVSWCVDNIHFLIPLPEDVEEIPTPPEVEVNEELMEEIRKLSGFLDNPDRMPVVGGAGSCWEDVIDTADWPEDWACFSEGMPAMDFCDLIWPHAYATRDSTWAAQCTRLTRQADMDWHVDGLWDIDDLPEDTQNLHTLYDVCLRIRADLRFRGLRASITEPGHYDADRDVQVADGGFVDVEEEQVFVGAGGAYEYLEESKRLNGPELMKIEAQVSVQDDIKSMPKTKYRLNGRQQKQISRYLGMDVMSQYRQHCYNGHVDLEIARDLLRQELDRRFPQNEDFNSVLHVGATTTEMRRWASHPGHRFQFACQEDKDIGRIYEDLTRELGKKIVSLQLPSVTTKKGNTTQIRLNGAKEMIDLLSKGNHPRIDLGVEKSKFKHDVLFFEDCLYSISQKQFADYWIDNNAKVGYSMLFIPEAMVAGSFAPPSDIYNYEEYYEMVEDFETLKSWVWPIILAVTPALPLPDIAELAHRALKWMMTAGWKYGREWLKRLAQDDHPLELALGVSFDLFKVGPIINWILELVKPAVRRFLGRVRVTWKSRSGNGYDHRIVDWERWAKDRRIRIGENDYVDSEIVASQGEMHLIKYWRSTGTSSISYDFALPSHRTAVQVLDLEASYNLGNGISTNLKYISVLSSDWYKLLNWALAEPIESISFAVMLTTLNRIRGGLSLNSNVLVEPMNMDDRDVVKIALAAYMEVCKRQEVIARIDSDPDLKAAWEMNLTYITKYVGNVLLGILSGGLSVALFFAYRWLREKNPTIEFVKYPIDPVPITIRGKRNVERTLTGKVSKERKPIDLLDRSTSLVIPHKQLEAKRTCLLCELQRMGKFSKTGLEEDGQILICENNTESGLTEIGFSAAGMTSVLNRVIAAKHDHERMNATKLVASIREIEHWVEANMGGLPREAEVHHIYGGPGTGKTEIIKALLHHYEKNGVVASVMMPFKELQADYINAEVIGCKELMSFDANTTWWQSRMHHTDILVVDECTGVDWEIIRLMAVYSGAKRIYLVGDAKQTRLNTAAGEGVDPLNPLSGLDMTKVPKHELTKNYRLDAWRTKYLNKKYGYRMRSVRTDILPPLMISKATFDAMKDDIERNFVFAHDSARPCFGVDSVAGDRENDNLSVRSAQGKTVKGKSAISAYATDNGVMSVHGMMCVAISRSTHQVYFVMPTEGEEARLDPVAAWIIHELCIDNQATIDAITHREWPKLDIEKPVLEMSSEEIRFDRIMRTKVCSGQVDILKDADEEDFFIDQVREQKARIVFSNADVEAPMVVHSSLLSFYLTQFHLCSLQAFWDKYSQNPEVIEEMCIFLGQIYNDDGLMGRKQGLLPSILIRCFSSGAAPLPVVDGRRYLPVAKCLEFMSKTVNVVLFRGDKCIFKTPTFVPTRPIMAFNFVKNHMSVRDETKVKIFIDGLEEAQEVDSLERYGDKYAFEILAEQKGKKPVATPAAGLGVAGRLTPTFTRVNLPVLERRHMNFATEHQPVTSSWQRVEDNTDRERIHRKTKLRLGTDAFRLGSFLDPSGASSEPMLNSVSAVFGKKKDTDVEVNWGGFIHAKTKAGKLRRFPNVPYRSVLPGFGNHFNNSPVESLVAADRIGKKGRKAKLNAETKAYARQVANELYRDFWRPSFIRDQEVVNGRVAEAIRVLKQRNYHGRADSELKAGFTPRLTCSNKDQFKPEKNGKLNLLKGGQVILQSPARTNMEFIAWMRVQGWLFKANMLPDIFTDDYESASQFRKRFTRAVKELPGSCRIAIADGEEWDSQQNECTLEIEKELCRLFSASSRTIEEYFAIRGSLPYIMFGVFKGTTNGEKGSGFLDTKLGNTKLAAALANRIIKGVGPRVVGVKGDDFIKIQSGITIDDHERRRVDKLLGMKISVDVGDGGEFCGNSVSRAGMYPSIRRAALKVLAAKAQSYDKFAAQQQSYRDTIQEYLDCGLEECVAYGALAEKISVEVVRLSLAIINSFAHINRSQWESVTKVRKNPLFFLPGAYSRVLI